MKENINVDELNDNQNTTIPDHPIAIRAYLYITRNP